MQFEVQLFAGLREAAGQARLAIDAEAPVTVARLKELIGERFPTLRPHLKAARVAVDLEFRDGEYRIESPNAEVALIPPVSGG